MSQEQRRGEAPDPKHDLYSLGVMWYQLLVGDVTRELHHGWARELEAKFDTPRPHINLIESCVGWFEERPKDAGELLRLLRLLPTSFGTQGETAPAEMSEKPADPQPPSEVTPSTIAAPPKRNQAAEPAAPPRPLPMLPPMNVEQWQTPPHSSSSANARTDPVAGGLRDRHDVRGNSIAGFCLMCGAHHRAIVALMNVLIRR